MSHRPDDDAPLDAATLRALADADDLVPTTEAEVQRAEGSLPDDLELPAGLRQYRPRAEPSNVRRLEPRRRIWTHAAALALGGAAVAAAMTLVPSPPPPVTSAGNELVKPSASAPARSVPLVYRSRCERECCAGADCKTASEALRSCPSGVRCAACAPDNVNGGPYRLRVGTMILSDTGRALLAPEAPLELCIVASATEKPCLPALGEPGGEAWRLLKVVSPLQDLLTGLTVELRKRGDSEAIATWKRPVSPTADVMCKGLAIQLGSEKETFGRLSVFVEPTHFLELSRGAAVNELLAKLQGFELSGIQPRVFESTRPGSERFALVLGPLERADADALRWQMLDHGREASVSHGLDFVGAPRPVE
jgi:hypothetical protein